MIKVVQQFAVILCDGDVCVANVRRLYVLEKSPYHPGLIYCVTGPTQNRHMHRITCTTLTWQRSMRQQYVTYVANCYGMCYWAFHLKH